MSLQVQTWLVFGLSFLACFVSLSAIFISPSERTVMLTWLMSSDKEAEEEAKELGIPPTVSTWDALKLMFFPDKEGSELEHDAKSAPDQAADGKDGVEGEGGEEDDEGVDEAATKTESFRSARTSVMKFLEGSLASMMKAGFQLDALNKFGCHLYLAGACERTSRVAELTHEQFVSLLEGCLSVLGSEKRIARRFGEKYEEYLLEPRYADMFRAGNEAMERFGDGDDDDGQSLNDALESWNTPSDQYDPDAPIAVMFTDIVGSTALNQTHGDEVAQKIVHTHNSVVRQSLQRHGGNEVKHTGDGIMASFKNITNAVKSAVAMQKALVEHNAKKPDIPLHIKIGVNAGTPIAEDGDLFGTTVQLAARICDKAGAGEICATNLVRELSQGSGAEFQSMGDFELKGVSETTTIYQVVAPGMAKRKTEAA